MTVQQMINRLQRVKDKNLEIVVRGIDPTSWEYHNEVERCGVEKVCLGEGYEKKTKVFVIDGGMF